jgi:hypothetical protein
MWHRLIPAAILALLASVGPPAYAAVPAPTVDEIAARNIAARGGARAWQAISALSVTGKLEAGSVDPAARGARAAENLAGGAIARTRKTVAEAAAAKKRQALLPFVLELKRPALSRLEIELGGQTAVQVFDGAHGWKLRPYLNRNTVEPFTADEERSASSGMTFDFPLLDARAQGRKLKLVGVESVEGSNAYKLSITGADGVARHVWIDAHSFLDVKVEGPPRVMDGRSRTVWTYQRDFRTVSAVTVPFVLETAVDGYEGTHKLLVERVALNPSIDGARFARPGG